MEAQLAAYRARKSKEFKPESTSRFNLFKMQKADSNDVKRNTDDNIQSPVQDLSTDNSYQRKEQHATITTNQSTTSSSRYFDEAATLGDGSSKSRQRLQKILKVTLWLIVWGFFIEIGFGAVFFVLSILIFVYFNTRTGPKLGDGPSAYSVFNPNCERIDGTFTAEQFEKELRYGAASVH